MTDHQSEHFMPDEIDEQIDASLSEEYLTQHLDPYDLQVVQMLHHLHMPAGDYNQPHGACLESPGRPSCSFAIISA